MITLKKEEESKRSEKEKKEVVVIKYIDFYRLPNTVADLLQIRNANKDLLLEEIDPYFEEVIRKENIEYEFLRDELYLTRPIQGLISTLDFSFSLKCESKNYIYVTFIYVPKHNHTDITHTYFVFVLKRPE